MQRRPGLRAFREPVRGRFEGESVWRHTYSKTSHPQNMLKIFGELPKPQKKTRNEKLCRLRAGEEVFVKGFRATLFENAGDMDHHSFTILR